MNPKQILALMLLSVTIGSLIGEAKFEEPYTDNQLLQALRVLPIKKHDQPVKDKSKLTKPLDTPDWALEIISEAIILTTSPDLDSIVKLLPFAINTLSSVLKSEYQPLIDLAQAGRIHVSDYVSERLVYGVDDMGSRLGGLMDELGVEEENYRRQSICYFGKSLRRAIPFYSEDWMELLPPSSLKKLRKNKVIDTFLMGFNERDCSSLSNYCEARNIKKLNTQ